MGRNDFGYKKLIIIVVVIVLVGSSTAVSLAERSPYFTPLRWSIDGKRIAISVNNIVEVLDDTNTLLYTLKGHADTISSVSWSPDNSTIATGSYDQTINLWNANDGSLVKTLIGQNDVITAVIWSQDSQRIISSGFDNQPNLVVWDVAKGNILSRHTGGTMVDASFSPDGTKFAYVNPLSVYILDTTSYEIIATSPIVACCANVITSIVWDPNSSKLATGSQNGLVTIWDGNNAKQLEQFVANTAFNPSSEKITSLELSWVRDVRFSLDGNTILSISGDGTLYEWDIATRTIIRNEQIPPIAVGAFSPFGARLSYLNASMLDASNNPTLQSLDTVSNFNVIVPFAAPERLQAVTQACGVEARIEESLTAQIAANELESFIIEVSTLTDAEIVPGCKADLLAVANALVAKGE